MIEQLNEHYSMQNIPSVYDEEALTALELVGRTTAKVNEVVKAQNQIDKTIDAKMNDVDNNVSRKMGEVDNTVNAKMTAVDNKMSEHNATMKNFVGAERSIFSDASMLASGGDANAYTTPGDYITQASATTLNLPLEAKSYSGFLSVRISQTSAKTGFVRQIWTCYSHPTPFTYIRMLNPSTNLWGHWEILTNRHNGTHTGSLDNLLVAGEYACENLTDSPFRTYAGGVCYVRTVEKRSDSGYVCWAEQIFFNTSASGLNQIAIRYYNAGVWGDWNYLGSAGLVEFKNGETLDGLMKNGVYTLRPEHIPSGLINHQNGSTSWGCVEVFRLDGGGANHWVLQRLTIFPVHGAPADRLPPRTLTRYYYSSTNTWTVWEDNLEYSYISSGQDLNDFVHHNGVYWVISTDNPNQPTKWAGILKVDVARNGTTGNLAIKQTYTTFIQTPNQIVNEYIRIIGYDATADTFKYNGWFIAGKPYSNKTVVCLGDSVIGNYSGFYGVAYAIHEATGMNVKNCCFGGTRYSLHTNSDWQAFDFPKLVDAIKAKNFSTQTANVNKLGLSSSVLTEFNEHLETLKNIDFSTVDYVLLHYGTNDWANAETTVTNFISSMRNAIVSLMTAFPNLKVAVVTPTIRFNFVGSSETIDNTSDEYRTSKGEVLPDYIEAIQTVCKELHLPCLDNYYGLGVNRYNWKSYFTAPDGVHPNQAGRKKLGYRIGNFINSL